MEHLEKIKYQKFIWPIAIALIIWLCTPFKPAGIPVAGWHMLAIFVGTIVGCITQPMPIGAVALFGFTITVTLGLVDMDDAAMAYFLSRGFIKTGFGRRVALLFVRLFGKKSLGLAYSLIAVDLVTAPATPSNTARSGGIVYPIIDSLAHTYGSDPRDGTARKMGAFLVFEEFHGDIITSGLFMTAMAPNLVAVALAKALHVNIPWMTWFIAGLVPAIISLFVCPGSFTRCTRLRLRKRQTPRSGRIPNWKKWVSSRYLKK